MSPFHPFFSLKFDKFEIFEVSYRIGESIWEDALFSVRPVSLYGVDELRDNLVVLMHLRTLFVSRLISKNIHLVTSRRVCSESSSSELKHCSMSFGSQFEVSSCQNTFSVSWLKSVWCCANWLWEISKLIVAVGNDVHRKTFGGQTEHSTSNFLTCPSTQVDLYSANITTADRSGEGIRIKGCMQF